MRGVNISIIIPTFRNNEELILCAEALKQQTYPMSDFEVIIVNNNPKNLILRDQFPNNFSIIDESKRGSYAARNTGINKAKGNIIGFTDADCIPENNWIKQAVNAFKKNPDIYRIAGKVELFALKEKPTPCSMYDQIFSFQQERYAACGTSVTANMFSRVQVFEKIGLFNENLKSGGDTEWGKRASAAGFNIIYAPTVIVKHPARSSFTEISKKSIRVYGGFFKIKKWDKNSVLINCFLVIYSIRPPVKALMMIFKQKSLSISEKINISKVLFRIRICLLMEHLRLTFGKDVERS